ncbi:MAG: ferritin family protein [Rhodopila sp.]|nr:ferritin family protein [Rhodopila sp.]
MATIKSSRTMANLEIALAKETRASRRYQAFAERADAEGNERAAALFRAIADRRSSHARSHMEALEPPGPVAVSQPNDDTAGTVRAAILIELHESIDLYPGHGSHKRRRGT